MNHAGSSGDRVGGRSGRSAHNQAITLDARHVLAFDKKIDVRKVRRGSSIHNNLVQYQKRRGGFGRLALFALARDGARQATP